MTPEKRASDQDLLADIRSGMSPIRLLEKYELSPRELLRTFDKLISQKLLTMEEYKSWEAGQKPSIYVTGQAKPLTPKPTPPEPTMAKTDLSKIAAKFLSERDWGWIWGYTIATSVGITFLGVLYTWALSERYPDYTVIEGISFAWEWSVLVAGITFSVKLKEWAPVLWSVPLFFLALVPVIGPLGCFWFLWSWFTELEEAKSGRNSSPGLA
jgi:hypothetical protein